MWQRGLIVKGTLTFHCFEQIVRRFIDHIFISCCQFKDIKRFFWVTISPSNWRILLISIISFRLRKHQNLPSVNDKEFRFAHLWYDLVEEETRFYVQFLHHRQVRVYLNKDICKLQTWYFLIPRANDFGHRRWHQRTQCTSNGGFLDINYIM